MFFFFKVGSIFLGDQLKLHLLLDSYEITRDSEIVVPMIRSSCHVWPCCTYHCLPGMTLKPSGSLVLLVHCVSYMDKINMSGPMFFSIFITAGCFQGWEIVQEFKFCTRNMHKPQSLTVLCLSLIVKHPGFNGELSISMTLTWTARATMFWQFYSFS